TARLAPGGRARSSRRLRPGSRRRGVVVEQDLDVGVLFLRGGCGRWRWRGRRGYRWRLRCRRRRSGRTWRRRCRRWCRGGSTLAEIEETEPSQHLADRLGEGAHARRFLRGAARATLVPGGTARQGQLDEHVLQRRTLPLDPQEL